MIMDERTASIESLFQKNQPPAGSSTTAAWGYFYEEYAPAMYGIIFNLKSDRAIAEAILTEAFDLLKERGLLERMQPAVWPCLLRFTYNFAAKRLKERQIKPDLSKQPIDGNLIMLLCTHCGTIAEAAAMLNMTEPEVHQKLHNEFLRLRHQTAHAESRAELQRAQLSLNQTR